MEKEDIKKIGVLGCRYFGEASAYALAKANPDSEIIVNTINQTQADTANSLHRFLKFKRKEIPKNIRYSVDPKESIKGADVLLSVLSVQDTKKIFNEKFKELITENWDNIKAFYCGSKGITTDTRKRLSETFQDIFPEKNFMEKYGYCFGPNFASGLINDDPSIMGIASTNQEISKLGADLFRSKRLRTYTTDDVTGAELIAALKNVVAIAAGMSDGFKFGPNSRASIVGMGSKEIKELALKLGAKEKSFESHSASVRDLEMTCGSEESRNFLTGVCAVDKNREYPKDKGVAEGVETVKAVIEIAEEHGIDVPICHSVYNILHKGENPARALSKLLKLPLE